MNEEIGLMIKQYDPERFLKPDLTFLDTFLNTVIYTVQSTSVVTFPKEALWGVGVSVDENALKANLVSRIEDFFKSKNIAYLSNYAKSSQGTSQSGTTSQATAQPGKPAISITIKVGDVQETFRLDVIEDFLFRPVEEALQEVIDKWYLEVFVRLLIPAVHRRLRVLQPSGAQPAVTPEVWQKNIDSFRQVIQDNIDKISNYLTYFAQNIENIEGIKEAVNNAVESVFGKVQPGSDEFSKVLYGLSERIASYYEQYFREEMTEEDIESIRRYLGDIKHTWSENVWRKKILRTGGLFTAVRVATEDILRAVRRKEGFGVWDLMKEKTKKVIFDLFKTRRTGGFDLESVFRSLNVSIVKYLNAPLVYLTEEIGPNLGLGQPTGGQLPQAPQIQPAKLPQRPQKPQQPPSPPAGPSVGRGRLPRIFFIKQIKIKEPKKVTPITKLPSLSDVVYRILLWWKNLSERDKAVLSSILRRYLTETDDDVRKELERELVSVAKGLGIPIKFKGKKGD